MISRLYAAVLTALAALSTTGCGSEHPDDGSAASSSSLSSVRAQPADQFVDSIGVVTHSTYPAYRAGRPLMQQRLLESGVRHIRDHWGPASANDTVPFLRELNRLGGIKVTMVATPRTNATVAQLQAMYRDSMAGLIDGVEGPNEWNLEGGANWAQELRDYQPALWRQLKSDPATASIPVLSPSIGKSFDRSYFAALGDLSAYADYGNLHDYPGGGMMSDAIIDRDYSNQALVTGTKPLIATETGYSTDLTSPDAKHPPLPPAQAGILVPRLYLEHFRRGFLRTFHYELLNEHPDNRFESNFGLLNNDYTPKPSFTSIKNLIALLADPGAAFTPQSLAYELTGVTPETRSLLLQKRDGTFYLAVWQQVEIWDKKAKVALNPPAAPLQLTLAQPTEVNAFYPCRGTAAHAQGNVRQVDFLANGEVIVLQLRPSLSVGPDLVVTHLGFQPQAPLVGQPVTFSAVIKNVGTQPTPAGVIHGVSFRVDGAAVSWSDDSTASLAPGEVRTVTANGGPSGAATWSRTLGAHTLAAVVDDVRRIAESNEGNNQYLSVMH